MWLGLFLFSLHRAQRFGVFCSCFLSKKRCSPAENTNDDLHCVHSRVLSHSLADRLLFESPSGMRTVLRLPSRPGCSDIFGYIYPSLCRILMPRYGTLTGLSGSTRDTGAAFSPSCSSVASGSSSSCSSSPASSVSFCRFLLALSADCLYVCQL